MGNFAFLKSEWPEVFEAASRAESHARGDQRSACFYARRALELLVHWVYTSDSAYQWPYDRNLNSLLNGVFRVQVPQAVYQKSDLVRRLGNLAVHDRKTVTESDAFAALRELWGVSAWVVSTYRQDNSQPLPGAFDEQQVPLAAHDVVQQSVKALQDLQDALQEKDRKQQELLAQNQQMQQELQQLQAQVQASKQQNSTSSSKVVLSEAETRTLLIDVMLREAGWDPHASNVCEFPVKNLKGSESGLGRVDYVLWGENGLPLAVLEAKRASALVEKGREQARRYADALEETYKQRPVIFYSTGYKTFIWDDQGGYPPREIQGMYTRKELQTLIHRRSSKKRLQDLPVDRTIIDRGYQEKAVRAFTEHLEASNRKGLLVMATGTGKTRVAVALCELLMRANWVKRVLFLADRNALVNQAEKAFRRHLPSSNPVNLPNKGKDDLEARVVVSTYQTMLNMIDGAWSDSGERSFGVGHFDLVIIDEAHRSVFNKYKAIFEYFDAPLLGLTATPVNEVDRNTYKLFDLEDGVPLFAYELEDAVKDGHLVELQRVPVTTVYMREGIKYSQLSQEQQKAFEEIDWAELGVDGVPEEISKADLNKHFFNLDTIDKVLLALLQDGQYVMGGDTLGKTIVFAVNHRHAELILDRLNTAYPQFAGKLGMVIDNYQTNAQALLEEFSEPLKDPRIAISVDMLDTGVDVPEVVNLVVFKVVRSKTKFLQMLGRGTRLSPDLHGLGQDKTHCRVFDFCGNYEFFEQHPKGFTGRTSESVGSKGFKHRIDLLLALQKNPSPDVQDLTHSLISQLQGLAKALPTDNLLVKPLKEQVLRASDPKNWENLSILDARDFKALSQLPLPFPDEDEAIRRFDNLLWQAQLALLEGSPKLKACQSRLMEYADLLLKKTSIPEVKKRQALLESLLSPDFWQEVTVGHLETVRERLRALVVCLERSRLQPIIIDLEDKLVSTPSASAPTSTGVNVNQYRKKVEAFVRSKLEYPVIQKIRNAQPLNTADLMDLEEFLFDAKETESRETFEQVYGKGQNLGMFIRKLVGLDRLKARKSFERYLDNKAFTQDQIQFIEFIIDNLTQNGTLDPHLLYEEPFTRLHSSGLDGVFGQMEDRKNIIGILKTLNQVGGNLQA